MDSDTSSDGPTAGPLPGETREEWEAYQNPPDSTGGNTSVTTGSQPVAFKDDIAIPQRNPAMTPVQMLIRSNPISIASILPPNPVEGCSEADPWDDKPTTEEELGVTRSQSDRVPKACDDEPDYSAPNMHSELPEHPYSIPHSAPHSTGHSIHSGYSMSGGDTSPRHDPSHRRQGQGKQDATCEGEGQATQEGGDGEAVRERPANIVRLTQVPNEPGSFTLVRRESRSPWLEHQGLKVTIPLPLSPPEAERACYSPRRVFARCPQEGDTPAKKTHPELCDSYRDLATQFAAYNDALKAGLGGFTPGSKRDEGMEDDPLASSSDPFKRDPSSTAIPNPTLMQALYARRRRKAFPPPEPPGWKVDEEPERRRRRKRESATGKGEASQDADHPTGESTSCRSPTPPRAVSQATQADIRSPTPPRPPSPKRPAMSPPVALQSVSEELKAAVAGLSRRQQMVEEALEREQHALLRQQHEQLENIREELDTHRQLLDAYLVRTPAATASPRAAFPSEEVLDLVLTQKKHMIEKIASLERECTLIRKDAAQAREEVSTLREKSPKASFSPPVSPVTGSEKQRSTGLISPRNPKPLVNVASSSPPPIRTAATPPTDLLASLHLQPPVRRFTAADTAYPKVVPPGQDQLLHSLHTRAAYSTPPRVTRRKLSTAHLVTEDILSFERRSALDRWKQRASAGW